MNKPFQNILIIGIDLTAIARSAFKAGYKVHAINYFRDLDLENICEKTISIRKKIHKMNSGKSNKKLNLKEFLDNAKSLAEKSRIEAVFLSSGLEDSEIIFELDNMFKIIGNRPDDIKRVRDRTRFFDNLKRFGIAHPKTIIVDDFISARSFVRDIGLPVMLKPLEGFAGFNVRKVEKINQLYNIFKLIKASSTKGVLIQEYIEGTHASTSFLSAKRGVRILSLNEQLLGIRKLHQSEPFGYCGNIVPINVIEKVHREIEFIVSKIASHYNLRGSNGIDIVISKDNIPHVVEINPRFQGTFECVERLLGVNLLKLHIDACIHDSLPIVEKNLSSYCTRLVLYTPTRVVAPDLTVFERVRDIPYPGNIIDAGEPFCSVIAEGDKRSISLENAFKTTDLIYEMLKGN
ncbi:MAG: ATP-grasp domain-containing protein [Promethearchaeota archaeon]|jgi:predicted ATP-grasp superfamily ATP-dependent carboligase